MDKRGSFSFCTQIVHMVKVVQGEVSKRPEDVFLVELP